MSGLTDSVPDKALVCFFFLPSFSKKQYPGVESCPGCSCTFVFTGAYENFDGEGVFAQNETIRVFLSSYLCQIKRVVSKIVIPEGFFLG